MRFLLDTNILIPLEDSKIILEPSLANFVRLATNNHHQLLYHPASEDDIARDRDPVRRQQTLTRLARYERLESRPACPWNGPETTPNDAADNEILFALKRNAAHALVTEDRGLHLKAKTHGLEDRVYYIQTVEDWLRRLHELQSVFLPNIREIAIHEMVVTHAFFDSLRVGYPEFNRWFEDKARDGRRAWVYGNNNQEPEAICIYHIQVDQIVTDSRLVLSGRSLKLCTFKVGESVRGRKIGELFLKTAFRYATENHLENIFITARPDEEHLVDLLEDFGFSKVGIDKTDVVFVKPHPSVPINDTSLNSLDYHTKYFPHYRDDFAIQKFIIPIQPQYHEILFPDSPVQRQLSLLAGNVGNAIKLAYLCHAQESRIRAGDIVTFYRSGDIKGITSLGVVESFLTSDDADIIAGWVNRRTVYDMNDIQRLAVKPTKVILFRLARHFPEPITHSWLQDNEVIRGNVQSIRKISEEGYRLLCQYAGQ